MKRPLHPRRPRPNHIYITHFTTNYPLTPATLRQQRDFWYQSYLHLADNTNMETP